MNDFASVKAFVAQNMGIEGGKDSQVRVQVDILDNPGDLLES
jgi:hypothetical protein